jgi:hypothetical protein
VLGPTRGFERRDEACELLFGFGKLAQGDVAAALDLLEDVGALGVLEVDGGEAESLLVGREGGLAEIDELSFDAVVTADEPDGADEVVDGGGLESAFGAVFGFEIVQEFFELGGVFAGEDTGLGVQAEFEGVAGGDGFPLG